MVRKRGSIDLEKCHSIITNFHSSCYKNIFIMKTVHKNRERDYQLACDSKKEMEDWVHNLCYVVGLNKTDFSCLTPTKMPLQVETVSRVPIIPSQTTSPLHKDVDDYLDLKDCEAGYQNDKKIEAALTYVNDVNRIQVYRSPNSTEKRKMSGEGSSVKTDFGNFLNVEDLYNVPRNHHGHGRDLSGEYKMPKCCGSASSGLDESFARENVRSPSTSSTSSAAFVSDYDFPPPKPHLPSVHNYTNSAGTLAFESKPFAQTSPHEVPLPLPQKVKTAKKDGVSQNGSSSSADAYKRTKSPDLDANSMSSSSSSSSDEDDADCPRSRLDDSASAEGVYNLPRRPSEFGRDALPSVFEESDQEKKVNSLPVVQKVQYLHLDFSEETIAEVMNSKPAPVNKVEYREIDFEKTRALNEVRMIREITKSQ